MKFLTLSFSGCGHLLPYQLGASSVFIEESKRSSSRLSGTKSFPRTKAVAGSSAGSIAAVLHSRMPHRIEEFAVKFISDRGHALKTLTAMLHEEENSQNLLPPSSTSVVPEKGYGSPNLYIATTKCADGSQHLFRYSGHFDQYSSISTSWTTGRCVTANELVEKNCAQITH